ncbi:MULTISPECIES: fatty acid desaturase family protein [unclassified Roseitalea]|uniref:fatty acid desaturase family protein n=1 Tax=unclassified Roseitalea TaxID=2639107 RepID=UPI00273FF1D8|nr:MULTISPECIES: fatty acid desaturase family protein [unclassified Roseitalea]
MALLDLIKFPTERDYSLTGPEAQRAIDNGLAGAEWYRTPIDRKTMKALMRRSDGPALRDTALWFALLALTAAGGVAFWGSWWAVPFFLAYGVLYGSAADSRWHECGHRTAFKTVWMNDVVYQIASFMMMRNPVVWRWSHTRHHTDTIIVGRDPEISGMRPPQLIVIGLNLFGLVSAPQSFAALARNAMGRLSPEEADFVPESERPKAYWIARAHMAIYAATLAACLAMGSILPAMLIGLPRLYGTWLLLVLGLPQHLGLAEDVLDHRLNARTVLMNPVLRFLYWNMNYHMEHHMYPMVPYHALPRLHEAVKHDCPPPSPSLYAAWREIVPCVLRQLRDPHHFIRPQLPEGAGAARQSPPLAAE